MGDYNQVNTREATCSYGMVGLGGKMEENVVYVKSSPIFTFPDVKLRGNYEGKIWKLRCSFEIHQFLMFTWTIYMLYVFTTGKRAYLCEVCAKVPETFLFQLISNRGTSIRNSNEEESDAINHHEIDMTEIQNNQFWNLIH